MVSKIDQVILMLKSTVCAFCLSGGRQFVHDPVLVTQVSFLFPKFFHKRSMQGDKLCWECHRKLKNVWNFHKQVEDACTKLIRMAKQIVFNGERTCHVNSLSTLKTQVLIAQVDIAPYLDTFVKIENVIHEPVQSDTDDPPCIKMEPIESNLDLRYDNVKTTDVIQQVHNKRALIVNPLKFSSATVTHENGEMRGLQIPEMAIAAPLESVKNIGQQRAVLIHNPCEEENQSQVDKKEIRENKNAHEEILPITNVINLESSDTNISFEDNDENLTPMINNLTDVDIPIMDFTNYGHIIDSLVRIVNIPIEDYTKDKVKINTIKKLVKLDKENKRIERNRSVTCYKDSFRIFNEATARNITEEQMVKLRQDDSNDPSYVNANFKCDRCIFGFRVESQFSAHMDKHTQESYGEEVCSVCELRFKDKEALDKHKQSHFIAFFCLKCVFGSRFLQSVAAHYNQQHRPAVTGHYCDTCEAVFESKEYLLTHLKIHSDLPTCHICNRSYKNHGQMRRHIREVHKLNRRVECPVCKKMFSNQLAMRCHKKLHQQQIDDKTYYCKECNKFFSSQLCYRAHLKVAKIHSATRHECDYCGKKYPIKHALAAHIMKVHLGKKIVSCKQCKRTFFNTSDLRQHETYKHSRAAPPPKKYICSQCGKAYRSMRILSIHQLTHTGLRPYHCPHCDYKATQKGALVTHAKYKHKAQPPLKYQDIAPHNRTET